MTTWFNFFAWENHRSFREKHDLLTQFGTQLRIADGKLSTWPLAGPWIDLKVGRSIGANVIKSHQTSPWFALNIIGCTGTRARNFDTVMVGIGQAYVWRYAAKVDRPAATAASNRPWELGWVVTSIPESPAPSWTDMKFDNLRSSSGRRYEAPCTPLFLARVCPLSSIAFPFRFSYTKHRFCAKINFDK